MKGKGYGDPGYTISTYPLLVLLSQVAYSNQHFLLPCQERKTRKTRNKVTALNIVTCRPAAGQR
jgi:hypothetical protein